MSNPHDIFKPFIEYMSFDDIIDKFSYYDMCVYRGDGYLYASPIDGRDYIPFLLHSHLTDGLPSTNLGSAVIYDIVKYNTENPPFVLITEGKHGLKNFIRANIFDYPAVNIIISVNGNKAYAYEYYDHTPTEIIEALPPWSSRVRTHHSIENETLQSAYNIPGVTFHPNWIEGQVNPFDGGPSPYDSRSFQTCVQDIRSLLNVRFVKFSSYMYAPSIKHASSGAGTGTATLILPQCCCCGKRVPTKYFWRIHGELCGKCVNRIRQLGTINIVTFGQAKYMLERQRALTRHANACNHNARCPVCDTTSVAWNRVDYMDHIGACGNCGTVFLHEKWKRFFFLMGDSVYEYSGRSLINIAPLVDHPVVKVCYICGSVTTKNMDTTTLVGDIDISICEDCGKFEAEG